MNQTETRNELKLKWSNSCNEKSLLSLFFLLRFAFRLILMQHYIMVQNTNHAKEKKKEQCYLHNFI